MPSSVCRYLVLVALLASCGSETDPAKQGSGGGKADDLGELPEVLPKRVIWFVGDGMGAAHLSGAAAVSDEPLSIFSMSHTGTLTTHEHEYVTTDSAASASAMASGEKTHFEGVGVVPGTSEDGAADPMTHLDTVVDEAQAVDWKTGIVVTTSVTDATPAGFAAHRSKRNQRDGIALDLASAGLDVLFGGGTRWFSDRPDGINLINRLRNDGYSVAQTRTGLRKVVNNTDNERIVGLLAERDIESVSSGDRDMALSEMVEHAITVLDRDNDDGFFLMVEGSWIDREAHALLGPESLAEVRDLDAAVAVALAYARDRDDTLVLVNADHETGGLAIMDAEDLEPLAQSLGGDSAALDMTRFPSSFTPMPYERLAAGAERAPEELPDAEIATVFGYMSVASRPFFTPPSFLYRSTHSPTMIPLFAEGPGAEFVVRARDNADLGKAVRAIIAEDGGAGGTPPPPPPPTPETPERLIVIAADGAGLSAWTAGLYGSGARSALGMSVVGYATPTATDRLVPDRAAAATALAVGQTTRAGAVAEVPGGVDLADAEPLLLAAERGGLRVGLVSTGEATADDAAAWTGNSDDRASALVSFAEGDGDGIDVLFAGGSDAFDADSLSDWEDGGADVDTSWSSSFSAGERTVRLLAPAGMPGATDRLQSGPSLEEMTEEAIDILDGFGDDFVLVVSAPGIADVAARGERGSALIDEVTDLDGAVRAALSYAQGRDDTAVVVVGLRDTTLSLLDNHYGFHRDQCGVLMRCGGVESWTDLAVAQGEIPNGGGLSDVVLQGDFSPIGLFLQYAWVAQAAADSGLDTPASAHVVPVFATGPGARAFAGVRTLADVGGILRGWL